MSVSKVDVVLFDCPYGSALALAQPYKVPVHRVFGHFKYNQMSPYLDLINLVSVKPQSFSNVITRIQILQSVNHT